MAPPDRGIGVDRLLAFADAVFAIAITLLALDITVPDRLPDEAVPDALYDALPHIGAYVLSFVVIGSLWLSHHRICSEIHKLDHTLVRLELCLLAIIAVLPFPTGVISEYGDVPIGTAVYAGSMAAAGMILALMAARLLVRPDLRHAHTTDQAVRQSVLQSAALTVVFLTSIPMLAVSTSAAQLWWLLVFPAHWLLQRR